MDNLIYLAVLVVDVIVILDIFKRSWDREKNHLDPGSTFLSDFRGTYLLVYRGK